MPTLENRVVTSALNEVETRATVLGSAMLPMTKKHSGKSGIRLLSHPPEAFTVRALLIKAAERTLDIQYYIWQKDVTGTLMLEALCDAAERGVRIRLLLDDNGIEGFDEILLAFIKFDNVQIRIFNPFTRRKLKWLGYITDFSRVNRRMHNKSLTVDNSVTVVGGRNIGDDYFGAINTDLKQDLDVLAIGEVVTRVSNDFDLYWASQSSYPIQSIASSDQHTTYNTAQYIPEQIAHPMRVSYLKDVNSSTFVKDLLAHKLSLEWTNAQMISDTPSKGAGRGKKKDLLFNKLTAIIGEPKSSLLLVSPYFVLTKTGEKAFIALAQSGVSIQVFTNAMVATDVLPVHAGYAKHRKALLRAGVQLFELRPTTFKKKKLRKKLGPFGSSASSLHAKTFVIDSQRLFVGSFNFDPRSMHLNTELGFVLDSSTLAQKMEREFHEQVRATAYEVKLNKKGKLYWVEQNEGKTIVHTDEPGMTLMHRVALSVLSALPIDWLL